MPTHQRRLPSSYTYTYRPFTTHSPISLQRAAANLQPKLDSLHADSLSRLYTLRTFQEQLGSECLANVSLSQRDCALVATYLSKKGACGFDGEVRRNSRLSKEVPQNTRI